MPNPNGDPPNPLGSDFGHHLIADLETRRRDPNKSSRIHAEFTAGIVANNDEWKIFTDTAIKPFPFMRAFHVSLEVIGVH